MTNHYDNNFYEGQKSGSLDSAREVIPIIIDIIKPKSVVDVGCGLGTWLKVFLDSGVNDVVGMDGDWVTKDSLYINSDNFKTINLEHPKYSEHRSFDLAMSLEVAEHLDKHSSREFIKFLTKLSPVVIFSAAIPYQGGRNHINEQWPDYWANIFSELEYYPVDIIRNKIWGNKKVEWWYRQNIIIFANKQYIAENNLKITPSDNLSLVHPEKYLLLVTELNKSKSNSGILSRIKKNIKRNLL